MSHAYHQNPESGGSGERSRAMRFEVPASSKRPKNTAENANQESVPQHYPLERNLREKDVQAFDTAPAEELIAEEKRAFGIEKHAAAPELSRAEAPEREQEVQANLHEVIAETWNESKRAGESWYKRMAGGAKDIAKSAGGLWREITRQNIDPEFEAGNFLLEGVRDVKRGFASMAGKKGETFELEPGVWVNSDQPSLLRILGEELSVYDLGTTMLKGVKEIGLGAKDAITEALTRNRTKEVKNIAEDFTTTASVTDAYEGAQDVLGDLIETNLEAFGFGHTATTDGVEGWGKPENKGFLGEVLDRKQEIGNAAKFVLGTGFLSEVYSGIRDKVNGKEKKSIESALREATRTVAEEGEIILAPALHDPKNAPDRSWPTDSATSSPANEWSSPRAKMGKFTLNSAEKPNPDGPDGGNREPLPEDASQETRYTTNAVKEAYEGLSEVARFQYEGVVDLGREYVKMFAYVGDQFRALAQEYANFDAQLKGKSPEQMRSRLAREAALAGSQRLEQAAVEANDIAQDAVAAKRSLSKEVAKARDNFAQRVTETEEQIYRRARLIAKDEAKSFGVAALRAEKSQLEHELDQYQAALEALDRQGKNTTEAKRKADAETIETYQSLVEEAEGQLARLNKSLDNPSKMSREHKDLIQEQMRALEADLDKYESIMAATKALDNLMPDAKKESAAA
jgi:hypothetical protein